MTTFTVLLDGLIAVVLVNLVITVRTTRGRVRWQLIGAQAALLGAGGVAAATLPTTSPTDYYWQLWSAIATIGASAFLGLALLFGLVWRRPTAGRRRAQAVALCLGSCLGVGLLLELYFSVGYAASDAFLLTTGGRNWVRRHWQPINSLGYRDREHPENRLGNRPRILVLGDSFAAGLGIERIADRFPDRLQQLLGERAEVYLAANFGWSTLRQVAALESFPVRPDVVILAYFVNDMEDAASRAGMVKPDVIGQPGGAMDHLLRYSSFLNFAYWRVYRMSHGELGLAYWDYLRRAASDPAVQREHRREMDALLAAAPPTTRWLVVLFPQLRDIPGSRPLLAPVRAHFEARGVRVLDLSPRLEDRPWRELVVSSQDSHPSRAVHREVAELILDELPSAQPAGAPG